MIGPLFDMFTAVMLALFFARFLNMCKSRTTFCLFWEAGQPGLAFYRSGPACLLSWLGMMNAGWLSSMRSEIFLQMKFIIFQGCPIKLADFLIKLLIQSLLLVPECYLHKILKLGFWILSPFFSKCSFHWLQHFSLWFWLSVWFDICILNCRMSF